jgi:hypothetical protein
LLRKIGEVAEDECELLASRSTFSLV